MHHHAPLGITCQSIDAVFRAVIESERALHLGAQEAPGAGEGGDSSGEAGHPGHSSPRGPAETPATPRLW